MSHITRIGIDTSKAVFTLHCVDDTGRAVLRTNLRRAQMVPFFRKLPPTEIAMEACGSSHHWARELSALGHTVRLIPPQYVKPFVKRAKNDRNDAEVICEAAGRPGMRFVQHSRAHGSGVLPRNRSESPPPALRPTRRGRLQARARRDRSASPLRH